MPKPLIYISACPAEFASARQRVAAIFENFGCETVWCDPSAGPDCHRGPVEQSVAACTALFQIVGDVYGDEPQIPDPRFGRCSWTQFEFLYASHLGRKTWSVIAGPGVTRDTAPASIKAVQQEYRQRPEIKYSPVARDDAHLDNIIPNPNFKINIPPDSFVLPEASINLNKKLIAAGISIATALITTIIKLVSRNW